MDCMDENTLSSAIVNDASLRALRTLNSRYARMIRIIEYLGLKGRATKEELKETLRREELPWRGVAQSLREMQSLGLVWKREGGEVYELTRLGGYVWSVIRTVKTYMEEVLELARKGELSEEDVIFSLFHIDLHILLSLMVPVEEQEKYHYPGLQAYVTLLISNVLSCIYNAPGTPYKKVFDKVLGMLAMKEDEENGPKGN